MADRYFFDKRDWKRRFAKYGIIFAISFLPIVLFNINVSKYFEKRWLLIFVDSVILLIFVVIGNSIANRIFERKDIELEKKKKERQILQERKMKIMEDSYKKIREEKQNKKEQKKIEDNLDVDIDNVATKNTIDNKSKSSNKTDKGRK